MAVRIITDSASDMLPGEHPLLEVLPLSVTFGETVYHDGVDLDHGRFYEMLIESDELPKTGQANPYAFSQAYAKVREVGDEAVVITLSSKLSGTHQSALTALAEQPGSDIYVVDSLNVCVGQRILVEVALSMAEAGAAARDIAHEIEQLRCRVQVIALLDTLEYLRKGGRISGAAGAVGEMLSVKPVVCVDDGAVGMLGKARGSKNGRNLLNKKVEEAGGIDFSMPLALGYTGLTDVLLQKYIRDSRALWEEFEDEVLPQYTIGATIGTHVGPSAIALAFFAKQG